MFHALLLDLNLTNRPVRTRMPGGVGGEAELTLGPPIPISGASFPAAGAAFRSTVPHDAVVRRQDLHAAIGEPVLDVLV